MPRREVLKFRARRAIVQVRAVGLIALLALIRRFIILYQTSPSTIAALAGVVFLILGSKEEPQEEEAEE
jgi:hypothetical protein